MALSAYVWAVSGALRAETQRPISYLPRMVGYFCFDLLKPCRYD